MSEKLQVTQAAKNRRHPDHRHYSDNQDAFRSHAPTLTSDWSAITRSGVETVLLHGESDRRSLRVHSHKIDSKFFDG
jgi:hypothetical protein